ncbi:MAG TPA: polysaccharide biosynthesis tyrosine autokinase [Pyrinomonadaceae bacterium]|nr:polysaccharide biosynthesis tyrosine autokinase [Pyrinomonadaceae bacterium]
MDQDQRLSTVSSAGDVHLSHNTAIPASYSSFYDEELADSQTTIRQYLAVIYKRLPLIIAIVILATAATAVYMYRQPLVFKATTRMIIEPRKPKLTSKDAININFGQDANYFNTQLQLLQSPDLMREVVIRMGLYREPNLLGNESRSFLSAITGLFSSSKTGNQGQRPLPVLSDIDSASQQPVALSPEEEERAARYAAILSSGLTVEQIERTSIVNLSIQSTNPELAAKVSTKLAEVFRERDAESETAGARKAVADLDKSIEELNKTISDQELELIEEMRKSNLPLQEKGQDLAAARLTQLSEAYMRAMQERRQLESRYNAAVAANSRGEGASIPEITESKIYQDAVRLSTERRSKLQDDIREIERQIQAAETQKSELLVKYTEEYPEVKKLNERIASLKTSKEKMEKEVSDIIERDKQRVDKDAVAGALVSLKSQLESKIREENQAREAYDRESALSNLQGQAQTRLTTLKRGIETNRNLLDTYMQRKKEQELAIANSQPDNIKIAAPADTPTAPVGPQRGRNIMIAFLVSLMAGIGLAFLLDYLDDSVKTSEDISRHLGLPTLALIPYYILNEKRKLLAAGSNGSPGTALVTLEEQQSPMAEAYRHLRTSLLFSSAGKPPQSILITSSQPAEGKTTTAVNTAITLAQAGVDVIIVDCDLRRPRLHNYFDLENSKGLTNYLSGDKNTENLIKSCRDLPRLKVITSGPIPPNPAELLSSNEMRNLIQFLRSRYKHIIIDSPPAISFTDAAILSTIVDGVVIVAMAGKSSLHLMRRFKQRLTTIGARIYGVVLNGLKSNSIEYEYYSSSYYDYYRSSSSAGTSENGDLK